MNRSHVSNGRLSISIPQKKTPSSGKNGTLGTRNGRGPIRLGPAENDHSDTNQNECEEGSDVGQISQ